MKAPVCPIPAPGERMKFFIYSRKSVMSAKGESIGNQIEACRRYIQSKFPGGEHEIIIFEDEGFSAKNTDRPQFRRMLRELETQKPDFIICYRLDRISRSVGDFAALIEDLNRRKVAFICVCEEFDTSKPMGKAMMYIASVFAQLERETIAERVRDNMLMLARSGRWLGGPAPTGYASGQQKEPASDGKRRISFRLKEIPDELAIVRLIFDKYYELRSLTAVERFLSDNGIKSRGGGSYSLPVIKQILQNPVYCRADADSLAYFSELGCEVCFGAEDFGGGFGLLVYNRRDCRTKASRRRTRDKWIIAVGRHRGLISGKMWVSVQSVISDSIPDGSRPALVHNDSSLLTGMIICGGCQGRMFAKKRQGSDSFDYICGNKLKGGTGVCSFQNLSGRAADELVSRTLIAHLGESFGFRPALAELKRRLADSGAREVPAYSARTRLGRCEEEIRGLIDALSRGELGSAGMKRISERIDELERERERLEADISRQEDSPAAPPIPTGLSRFFGELSIPEKRVLVRAIADRIVWDGERLHIYLN